MRLSISYTDQAKEQLKELKNDQANKAAHKAVSKILKYMAADLRHPSLGTHKYDDYENPIDKAKPVFEAYAQNNTPGAYRVFWVYGPDKQQLTILAITPHP